MIWYSNTIVAERSEAVVIEWSALARNEAVVVVKINVVKIEHLVDCHVLYHESINLFNTVLTVASLKNRVIFWPPLVKNDDFLALQMVN